MDQILSAEELAFWPGLDAAGVAGFLESCSHLLNRRLLGVEVDERFFLVEIHFHVPHARHGFEGFYDPRRSTTASGHTENVEYDLFHVGVLGTRGVATRDRRGVLGIGRTLAARNRNSGGECAGYD